LRGTAGLLEPTGLTCEVIQVTDAERHLPGGMGALPPGKGPGTALLLARG